MCGFLTVSADKYDMSKFEDCLALDARRGPDMTWVKDAGSVKFGFNRLSIMDLSPDGMQPFEDHGITLVCNGEIYNYQALEAKVQDIHEFQSGSDCEVLLPLYRKYGLDIMSKLLDGEFALVMHDQTTDKVMAVRDPMGIRPMFYGYTKEDHAIAFASTAKSLMPMCDEIFPFPPGHYYDGEKFVCYNDLSLSQAMVPATVDEATKGIHDRLVAAVEKRIHADAPLGYLLSGGLDSSLVCAIAKKNHPDVPMKTFAIGMDRNPIDLKYAREVADYLGTDHTEFIMTRDDVLGALREVIYALETWDITTIRASIGMYLLCKQIHATTDLKVLMTGECSDEMFGYKYTDYAPSPAAFQAESQKRIRELYMYDVLRADRCISSNSLEGRVPFADRDFVRYVMALDPAMKMNVYGKGKYLLRQAFAGQGYLPDDILLREKAAFSDAVGHSLVDDLKEYAEELYTDEDVAKAGEKYDYATPFTKESLLYRDIFEEFFPGKAKWIKDFWMPNKEWDALKDVDDPSARVLANYGDSGK